MADHHAPAPVSDEAIRTARDLWKRFTQVTTVVIVISALVLLAMALFLA